MNPKRLFSLLLILSSVSSITSFAQSNKIETSIQTIKELKQGILIVILPSYHKKIKELEKIESNPITKASTKKRHNRLIKSAKEDQQKIAHRIQQDFIENYDFSEFAFIYDTATVHLLKNDLKKGVFLKDEKQIDLTDKSIFFLRYGHTDVNTTTGIGAWIVTDNQLQDLQRPFPYFISVFRPLSVMVNAIFRSSQSKLITTSRNENKGIGLALNDKFWNYYKGL